MLTIFKHKTNVSGCFVVKVILIGFCSTKRRTLRRLIKWHLIGEFETNEAKFLSIGNGRKRAALPFFSNANVDDVIDIFSKILFKN